MATSALHHRDATVSDYASQPLREAQRRFAALIDDAERFGAFALARVRTAAREALSELSADDRSGLVRWLALQLATRALRRAAPSIGSLTGVDALLGAQVRAELPGAATRLTRDFAAQRAVA